MLKIFDRMFLNELQDHNADKDTIKALHNAIINKRMISFDYEDDPDTGPRDRKNLNRGWRTGLEPVYMGFGHKRSENNDNELYLRAWQNGGVSKRGIPNGKALNWKLYKLSRIRNVNFLSNKNFDVPREKFKPLQDKTIKMIHKWEGVPSMADFGKEGVEGDLALANAATIFKGIKKTSVSKDVDRLDLNLMPDLSVLKNKTEWLARVKPDLKRYFTAEELPSVEKAIEDKLNGRKLKTLKELFGL